MIACFDVQYEEGVVRTACVGFEALTDEVPSYEQVLTSHASAAPYQPGEFYKRELPCILAAIEGLPHALTLALVDGYVWLGSERPGLGARLHEALGARVPVIGVAKNAFYGASPERVYRGESRKPLYVTAIGVDLAAAARGVRAMHGAHRLPTLLKRVDQLARGARAAI